MQVIPGMTGLIHVTSGIRPARSEEVRRPDEPPPITPPAPVQKGPGVVRDQNEPSQRRLDVKA